MPSKSGLKICFISNPDSTHTRRWIHWFHQRGHTVSLIADTPMQLPWPGQEIFHLTKLINIPLFRFPIWELWVRHLLMKWRPQILHAHRVSSAGWLGSFSGFHPFVLTPWGTDLYQHAKSSPLVSWLARFALQRADLVTADSNDLLAQAVRFGARPECSMIVQWGVDFSVYHPWGKGAQLREELDIGNRPVILSPRAVRSIYNLETIIEAMPMVLKRVPDAVLVLRDYNTNESYKQQIQKSVTDRSLSSSVQWLGRVEPWERNVEIYRMADVVVSVPSSDGTPVSVLEAMACGVPVIASDLPSLREWIEPDRSGLLVPVRDPVGLADAITKVLTDKAISAVYAQRALDIVRSRADHEREMEKMEESYYSLLG